MNARRSLSVAAGLLTAAPLVMAAQVTTRFAVTATVVRGCVIATTDLVFGNYPAFAGAPTILGTSTVRVTCQLGDTYTIGLNDGGNPAGAQRRMARTVTPLSYLNYNLFQDPARTIVWRDTGQTRLNAVGTGTPQTFTVYGQLPGAQVVPVGAYVDTVTVTVRN